MSMITGRAMAVKQRIPLPWPAGYGRHVAVRLLLLCALAGGIIHGIILFTALHDARLLLYKPTPLFEDARGRYLSDLVSADGTFGYWDIEGEIPSRIAGAVLAIEDKRFYNHPGIDPRSLIRSLANNLAGGKIQGASTIAMQVARMQKPADRSLWNKVVEMYTALFLVAKYGHTGVLKQYLKIIPQGNQMRGVVYAARRYFRKPPQDLSWAEAAVLAAVLKAPGRMNLFTVRGFSYAASRAQLILSLLYREKKLDQEAYTAGISQLVSMSCLDRENRPDNSYHYVLRLAEKYKEQRMPHYFRPVRTALDLDIQDFLGKVARFGLDKYLDCGASNISIMVADKNTGAILGYIGSGGYFNETSAGAINYAATPRSSGSILKPFLYSLGLQERYFTPASVLADLPLAILSPTGEYIAGNFDDEYLGPMLYRRALANSRNIPAVRVLEAIGPERVFAFFKTLGLVNGAQSVDYYGYGLVLGGLYVTLEQLITAYGILANDGREFSLQWGGITPNNAPVQLISQSAARQITLFLSDSLARLPSFSRLNSLDFPFPVAVKTGTSQGFRDAWSLAYSSRYIAGIWIGHHENNRMKRISGSASAELLRMIFACLQPGESKGINEEPFPVPAHTAPVKICAFSGKLAAIDCTQVSVEYFEEGYAPHELCDYHCKYAVDKRTGRLADAATPPSLVTTKTYTVFPPEYAAWAAKKGYMAPQQAQEILPAVSLRIVSPVSGSRVLIDPETPRRFQSIPLQAEVQPAVKAITWFVDGKEYCTSVYPYAERWSLEEGTHIIQARFARAEVYSAKVLVKIDMF